MNRILIFLIFDKFVTYLFELILSGISEKPNITDFVDNIFAPMSIYQFLFFRGISHNLICV